jgi:hypothetical protein
MDPDSALLERLVQFYIEDLKEMRNYNQVQSSSILHLTGNRTNAIESLSFTAGDPPPGAAASGDAGDKATWVISDAFCYTEVGEDLPFKEEKACMSKHGAANLQAEDSGR